MKAVSLAGTLAILLLVVNGAQCASTGEILNALESIRNFTVPYVEKGAEYAKKTTLWDVGQSVADWISKSDDKAIECFGKSIESYFDVFLNRTLEVLEDLKEKTQSVAQTLKEGLTTDSGDDDLDVKQIEKYLDAISDEILAKAFGKSGDIAEKKEQVQTPEKGTKV